jgi:hypothetical protein
MELVMTASNQAETAAAGAVQEAAPVTKVVGKTTKGKATTGNLIADIANEVEQLTKPKAITLASNLAEDIETNYFKLGGVLRVINDNSWFEGFESFDVYVYEKFGFQGRKARYLIQIYTDLVTNQIPWDKVQGLGWTKLKDLSAILTLENVDEWVAKAEKLTVLELQNLLKAGSAPGDAPSAATTDDTQTMKFKLKNDQVETVQSALNKCKAEVSTEFDNVAIENICAAYLGGVTTGQSTGATASGTPQERLNALMTELGWEESLTLFSELFPAVDLQVSIPDEAAAG